MNTLSKNPFNTGSPARGEGFLGRHEIILNIISFIRNKSQFNLLIFGQRRIGKTSLLRKLQDDLGLREITSPVYFSLQDKASIELSRLLVEIANRIVDDLDLKIDFKVEQIKLTDFPIYFQNEFIPLVVKVLPEKKQLLLLFDEFDVLGEAEDVEDDSIVDTFASKKFISFTANLIEDIQAKKYPVKFIFAVGRNYKDLEPKRFGQIMKFGPQEELSYFSKKETFELIKSSDSCIPFDEGAMEEIFLLASGHPYFSQCLASYSFTAAEKQNNDSVTREIVRQQIINSIKSFSSGVYWIWDSLSPNHQIILYVMAVLGEENLPINMDTIRKKASDLNVVPVLENLAQVIDKLKTFKFIRELKQGEFVFYVEFIRKWIVREVSGAEISKLLDQIDEEIGFHLNNARYFFKKKDYKQAVQHYDDILKKSPYHFEALLFTARCYKILRDKDFTYLDKALEFYKKSYELNRHKVKKEYLNLLLEKLKYLEEKNEMEGMGDEIELILKEIQTLDHSNSKIAEKLVELYILENRDISELEHLSNVNEINLENKGLINLPKDIVLLENLRKLDLRKNKISQLPAKLLDLGLEIKWKYDGKDGIFLADNPMEIPPVEIVQEGPGAIKRYFKSLEGEELRTELKRLIHENVNLKKELTVQQQNMDQMCQKVNSWEKLARKWKKLLRKTRIFILIIFVSLVIFTLIASQVIERNNEANRKLQESIRHAQEVERQSLINNYNLAKFFEVKALIALKFNRYKQAWLYMTAALKQEIGKDKFPLNPDSVGVLLTPEVIRGALSEKWVSHSKVSHYSPIDIMALSPDGRILSSNSGKGTINLIDLSAVTRNRNFLKSKKNPSIRILKGFSGYGTSFTFSPDGKIIAFGSYDNSIRFWDLGSGRKIKQLRGHSGYVTNSIFSPDGEILASSSYDKTIRLWNLSSGSEIYKFEGHSDEVTSVAFSPDGKILASGSRDNTIRFWNVRIGKETKVLTGHSLWVNSIAFSPNGKTLVSGSLDETIRLWDVSSGKEICKLSGHSDNVNCVVFSPDGNTLASGSDDDTICLWDVSSGKEICKLSGHSDDVNCVVFSPDGNTLISGSDDETIQLWDVSFFNLFLKNGKLTPLFYSFSEGAEFFWGVRLDGLEYEKIRNSPPYPEKFSSLMNSPRKGQSKFEQILEWAKKQQ